MLQQILRQTVVLFEAGVGIEDVRQLQGTLLIFNLSNKRDDAEPRSAEQVFILTPATGGVAQRPA